MDSVDLVIVRYLQGKGRMSFTELANKIKHSPSATAERVKKLESLGVIKKYSALLDYKVLGVEVLAFIIVTLDNPSSRLNFTKKKLATVEIEECHHIVGKGDYLLKIRCKNINALEELISMKIKDIDGIAKTDTTIVLSSIKEDRYQI